MNKRWTEKEIAILEEHYPKLGPTKIQKLLPERSIGTIKTRAWMKKIKALNKYSHDEKYFKQTQKNQAFIAGFIAADGCILDTKQGQKTLEISLAQQDKDILKFIKDELRYTGEIKYKTKNNFLVARLHIYSADKLTNDLKEIYKITPRKTFTLEYPDLKTDEEHIKYIAGVFAGDGYANKETRGYTAFEIISGSKTFLEKLSKKILYFINYSGDKTFITKHKNVERFRLSGKNAEAWIKLMWKTDFPKLPKRKWDKIKYLKD